MRVYVYDNNMKGICMLFCSDGRSVRVRAPRPFRDPNRTRRITQGRTQSFAARFPAPRLPCTHARTRVSRRQGTQGPKQTPASSPYPRRAVLRPRCCPSAVLGT